MKHLAETEVGTPTAFEVAFKRIFGVSQARLFDAWTQVEHVRQWWDPRAIALAACEIDLRVGGRFRFLNQPMNGVAHEFAGTYLEIVRPRRLVFQTSSPVSVGTLTFEQLSADQTELRMTIECTSTEQRDTLIRHGVVDGTRRTLTNLEEHLAADREGNERGHGLGPASSGSSEGSNERA